MMHILSSLREKVRPVCLGHQLIIRILTEVGAWPASWLEEARYDVTARPPAHSTCAARIIKVAKATSPRTCSVQAAAKDPQDVLKIMRYGRLFLMQG
jgi:hypothetical protein